MSIKLADVIRLAVRDPELGPMFRKDPEFAKLGEDEVIEMLMLSAATGAKDEPEMAILFSAVKRVANQIYDQGVAAGRALVA